jgi:putative component of membrane protein insertase Oxa1/YidC/SpoIIIJ protein YidD
LDPLQAVTRQSVHCVVVSAFISTLVKSLLGLEYFKLRTSPIKPPLCCGLPACSLYDRLSIHRLSRLVVTQP